MRQDSNSRPFEHESSPLTTRPGLHSYSSWPKIVLNKKLPKPFGQSQAAQRFSV